MAYAGMRQREREAGMRHWDREAGEKDAGKSFALEAKLAFATRFNSYRQERAFEEGMQKGKSSSEDDYEAK